MPASSNCIEAPCCRYHVKLVLQCRPCSAPQQTYRFSNLLFCAPIMPDSGNHQLISRPFHYFLQQASKKARLDHAGHWKSRAALPGLLQIANLTQQSISAVQIHTAELSCLMHAVSYVMQGSCLNCRAISFNRCTSCQCECFPLGCLYTGCSLCAAAALLQLQTKTESMKGLGGFALSFAASRSVMCPELPGCAKASSQQDCESQQIDRLRCHLHGKHLSEPTSCRGI